MLSKRALVTFLAFINVFLLGLVLATAVSMPSARANSGRAGGPYACVTAQPAGVSYDVLYMLDTNNRKLYAFHPSNAQGTRIAQVQPRDLGKDFQR